MPTGGYLFSREQRLYGALRHAEEDFTDGGQDGRAAGMREAIRLVVELLPDAVWEWNEIPHRENVDPEGEDRQALRDARMLLERLRFHSSLAAGLVDDSDVVEAARLAPLLDAMTRRPSLSDEEYAWVECLRARPESRPAPEVVASYLSAQA